MKAMLVVLMALAGAAVADVTVDPITRCFSVSYQVPADAPDVVSVNCSWSPADADDWKPARVTPLVSETALALAPDSDWTDWAAGRVMERGAAGLTRTVVFNPYPEAQPDGQVNADIRIVVRNADGAELASSVQRLQADQRDVVYLEDWSKVFQATAITKDADPGPGKWWVRSGLDGSTAQTLGNDLLGRPADANTPLPQLSYPLDLKGDYAVFACTLGHNGILLRLSGDERADSVGSAHDRQEVLWNWRAMDRQHIVLRGGHGYTGYSTAELDYIKLVPLSPELRGKLDAQFGTVNKIVAGYWEPYSWAFVENVQDTLQHRAVLTAFQDARIRFVDTQLGRFGMKNVFETRAADQLLYSTIGDPVPGDPRPTTDNVGRMQQYTNALDATLRYCRELGMQAVANFGASNCYPGSPLQGDFSKAHPEWMRSHALRFEVPEVRDYALSLYREALEAGAETLSIDYCRYPETIDVPETANTFMAALRALADAYGAKRGGHVAILTRFPGTGVRSWQNFDYARWAREGWVDYLCPGNIQGRHMHIDMTPYFEAVKGTRCVLLPALEGLDWGLPMPGPFLWRAKQVYDQGAAGVYVYQADGRVLGRPEDRRTMRLLASGEAVNQWWNEDARLRPARSKGIYLSRSSGTDIKYQHYERLRIWVDGLPLGPMEIMLDDNPVNKCDGPPYLVGTEDNDSDKVIPSGEHKLTVRVKDGDGWFEQTFTITGA